MKKRFAFFNEQGKYCASFTGDEDVALKSGYELIDDNLWQYIPNIKKVDGEVVIDEEAIEAENEQERILNEARSKQVEINIRKELLSKIKEDIEQVEFGLVRDDYEAKKLRACELINEIRVLEGKEAREIKRNN